MKKPYKNIAAYTRAMLKHSLLTKRQRRITIRTAVVTHFLFPEYSIQRCFAGAISVPLGPCLRRLSLKTIQRHALRSPAYKATRRRTAE